MAKNSTDSRKALNLSRRELLALSGTAAVSIAAVSTIPAASAQSGTVSDDLAGVQALIFDVFGTVVDWRSSIIREGQLLSARKGFDVNWAEFADRWRSGYGPAMNQVRTGELPWTKIDDLHRMILNDLIVEYGLGSLTEEEIDHFNKAWHRLMPWPDSAAGLNRLKTRYIIATMSNGNVSLLLNMGKNAGLPWDTILSAELSGHYKPDPEAYLKAAELLSLEPEQVMMVAAHPGDLRAAAALGFKTGYVYRPLERGPERRVERNTTDTYDVRAEDFVDLAKQMGA